MVEIEGINAGKEIVIFAYRLWRVSIGTADGVLFWFWTFTGGSLLVWWIRWGRKLLRKTP